MEESASSAGESTPNFQRIAGLVVLASGRVWYAGLNVDFSWRPYVVYSVCQVTQAVNNPYRPTPVREGNDATYKSMWVELLKLALWGFAILGGLWAAFVVPSWLYFIGISPWLFVVAVILTLAMVLAKESWRTSAAFLLSVPPGFLIGAALFPVWFWIVGNTSFGELFNGKGSGPTGVLLFVLLPSAAYSFVLFSVVSHLLHRKRTHEG
jgi:hypothetical protein